MGHTNLRLIRMENYRFFTGSQLVETTGCSFYSLWTITKRQIQNLWRFTDYKTLIPVYINNRLERFQFAPPVGSRAER